MNNLLRFAILFALVLLTSCDAVDPFDIDEVDFGDPEIGVPLVNSTFFIADLGVDPDNNTEVLSDDQGRVTLRYSDQLDPISIAEIFPPVTNEVVNIVGNNLGFPIPFNDIAIRKGVLKDTRLTMDITNPVNQPVSVTVTITGIKDQSTGAPFRRTFQLAANEAWTSAEIDLSGMNVDTPQGFAEFSYSAHSNSNPDVTLQNIRLNVKSIDFSYLEGVFDNAPLPSTEDLIDIEFFNSWVSGGLSLSDPKIIFDIHNSIGIPAELKLNAATVTTISNQTIDLDNDLLTDGLSFAFPSLSEVGESKTTQVEINSENSNIIELFESKPTAIDYDLDLGFVSDPSQPISFYNEESNITIDASVELPLLLKANDLILQDTIPFADIEFEDIEGTGELKISLINAFPIGVGVNLYFLNSAGQELFSLVEGTEYVSVLANGNQELTVDELEPQISSIPISEEDILLLPLVHNVLIKVQITTTEEFDDEYVWVYDHHGIDVKLGAILR